MAPEKASKYCERFQESDDLNEWIIHAMDVLRRLSCNREPVKG